MPPCGMRLAIPSQAQITSKFPFRWWGVNSALSGSYQLNGQPGPHSAEEEALDASESRDKIRGVTPIQHGRLHSPLM